MLLRLGAALGLACLTAGVAMAQATCPLTYVAFEFAVPHLDLEKCPTDLAREGLFCRATTGNDAVHVFVFARDGDQCLLTMKSYKDGQYELIVK